MTAEKTGWLERSRAHSPDDVARYHENGWWADASLGEHIERHAAEWPEKLAYISGETRFTWADYDRCAKQLAAGLLTLDLPRGARVAVWLPDGPTVHVAFVAAELAGLVAVGVGARAGARELKHLVERTGCSALVTHAEHRGHETTALFRRLHSDGAESLRHHVIVPDYGEASSAAVTVNGTEVPPTIADAVLIAERRFHPDELSMINSTSGTTGLPKCVMHNQNRWWYFHQRAVQAADLTSDDVFCSVVPAPFGFGLWTAHYTPAYLGSPCLVMPRFDAGELIARLAAERVTVLSCVSTQFVMMLASPALGEHDLSSLRVMFTGGEAVPYEQAAAFEERTGAMLLQFYGSNETGALSQTTRTDSRDIRLRSAGALIDEMRIRLFDEAGCDVTATGRGRPAGRGPATCLGYWDDTDANDELFTPDGWMLMGDIVEIENDVLRVVGRTSDFIIRGGKNISAPQVEEEVCTHPAVALAAAVPVPDPVFGERVCVYVELRDGATLTLDELVDHLRRREVGTELLPERLVIVDELPRSSGGKVAKGELRAAAASAASA